jgi:hypothetical protein
MDEDAVMTDVWRRIGAEAAGAREALAKLDARTAPEGGSLEDSANRLQRSAAILAQRDRHKDRLSVLAELWCHYRGGDPNELVSSLLADESPD